jgi:WD40 repeat protein
MTDLPRPYVGLRPYTADDSRYFFGRETYLREMATSLLTTRFTVLYGASGVGKSSLVLASLAPYLHRLPDVVGVVFRDWRTGDALAALKQAIIAAADAPLLLDATRPLDSLLAHASTLTNRAFAIILDQFEDLLHSSSLQALNSFDLEFVRAVNREDLNANFLVVVREDALPRLAPLQGRITHPAKHSKQLLPLTRVEAARAIRRPLEVFNAYRPDQNPITIEDALVDELLSLARTAKDESNPANYAVETACLQLMLTRLWEADKTKEGAPPALRLAVFRSLGGGAGLARAYLDEVMSGLDESERVACGKFFAYLATPSGKKIPQTLDDVSAYAEQPRARLTPLLEALDNARVLRALPPLPTQDTPRYEPFHDLFAPALISWQKHFAEAQERLRAAQQLEEARREQTRIQAQLQTAEDARLAAEREKAAALTRAAQETAQAEQAQRAAQAAKEKAEADAREKAKRAQLDAAAAKEKAEADARAAIAKAQAEARYAQESVIAREIALHANATLAQDPELSLLLAIRAVQHAPTFDAMEAMRAALLQSLAQATLQGHTARITDAAWSPNGQIIVTTSDDSTVRVWQRTGNPAAREAFTVNVLREHHASVSSVAFSRDGERFVTGSHDHTVRVWSTQGQPLALMLGHIGSVYSVAFSPDGRLVVSAGEDNTARVWDARTGELIAALRAHHGIVYHAEFSPSGQYIVSASADGTARLWDALAGTSRLLQGHQAAVYDAVFAPNGKRFVTASGDSTARVWDIEGRAEGVLVGHLGPITHAAFSPDGLRIVTASVDGTAHIWQRADQFTRTTWRDAAILIGHAKAVTDAAFSPDGLQVVTASDDGTARVWTVTGKEVVVLRGHLGGLTSAQFSADGQRVLTTSHDLTARLWGADQRELIVMHGHTEGVYHAAFAPDGQFIVTSSYDDTARVWEALTGREQLTLYRYQDVLDRITFSHDGLRVGAAVANNLACMWNVMTGKVVNVFHGHTERVNHVAFSPDDQWLVTASADGTARVWEIQPIVISDAPPLDPDAEPATLGGRIFNRNNVLATMVLGRNERATTRVAPPVAPTNEPHVIVLRGHNASVTYAAFNMDGTQIVTASADGTARIWDAVTGAPLTYLRGHTAPLTCAVFSSDGEYVVTTCADGTARVWSLRHADFLSAGQGRQTIAILRGHTAPVHHASFSPDGQLVVTASADGTARLWRAQSGEPVAVLRGHTDAVYSAHFSPDGTRVITASADGSTRIFLTRSEDLLALAQLRATRTLTAEEKAKYLYEAF